MATANWLTYSLGTTGASGIRDDILDLLTMIDPWDTPFVSSAPKVQVSNVEHFWFVDALAATSTAGAAEGDDFSGVNLTARTRLSNYTQIFRKDIFVSDTIRQVNPVGVRDEYEYQVMKAMREIARNIERRVFDASATAGASGASATVRVLKPFRGYALASASSTGLITTAAVNSLMETVYTNGGNPDALFVSPGVKADFSQAAGGAAVINTRNIAAADKKVVQNIDVWESDFGLVAVIPDRFIAQSSATGDGGNTSQAWYVLERAKAQIGFLRPIRHVPIGKAGDSTRGIVVGEVTLQVLHPSAHGYNYGVTT